MKGYKGYRRFKDQGGNRGHLKTCRFYVVSVVATNQRQQSGSDLALGFYRGWTKMLHRRQKPKQSDVSSKAHFVDFSWALPFGCLRSSI